MTSTLRRNQCSHTNFTKILLFFCKRRPKKCLESRKLIFWGALLYFSTRTRPDMSTDLSLCTKFHSKPGPKYWRKLKPFLWYLACTTDFGLRFPHCSGAFSLQVRSIADQSRDQKRHRSPCGYFIFMSGRTLIWSSQFQSANPQYTNQTVFTVFTILAPCFTKIRRIRALLSWSEMLTVWIYHGIPVYVRCNAWV